MSNPEDRFEHSNTGNYAKDSDDFRAAYVGKWEYNQDGIQFILQLTKEDQSINAIEFEGQVSHYNYFDELRVRYKLVKNGIVLFDNLDVAIPDPVKSYGYIMIDSPLRGRILDHTRNVIGSYTVRRQLTLNGLPKIFFNLYLGNYTMLNPPAYYQDGQPLFSIPTGGIEMVKVN